MYVHCSTVFNSKDLESTQMPINDRLEKENVTHIHHGILCSHKKWWVSVLCRVMDEPGNHHSQQTDTRTENQIPRIIIGRCWTMRTHGLERGASHTGVCWGELGEGQQGVRRLGRDNMGSNARYRWWGDGGSKAHCHVCTYATIPHDLCMYPRT